MTDLAQLYHVIEPHWAAFGKHLDLKPGWTPAVTGRAAASASQSATMAGPQCPMSVRRPVPRPAMRAMAQRSHFFMIRDGDVDTLDAELAARWV